MLSANTFSLVHFTSLFGKDFRKEHLIYMDYSVVFSIHPLPNKPVI